MDFSKIHFGKPIHELELPDIEKYFERERTETDQLEFKSINPNGNVSEKFSGLQRTICAFLNSSGGLLIWGAPEGKLVKGQKEKTYSGELTFLNEKLEKDFLVSKVSDSIVPLPNNIRFKIFNEGNKSMAIFEVASSEYSPHQTGNTYYMRIDGQSKPAPHHYIEALFKKITYPNIEAYIKIADIISWGDKYRLTVNIYFINWSELQNEEKLYYRIVSNCCTVSKYPTQHSLFGSKSYQCNIENAKNVLYFGEPIEEICYIGYTDIDIHINPVADIVLTFGGKFSPLKACQYSIDFSKIDFTNLANSLKNVMVKIYENKMMKDIQDEKGSTKESIINDILRM